MDDKNRTKYIVLGMLTVQPSSGYEINKMIKSSTNYFWSESEGQIYPALAKCVADGLATCKEKHAPNNARIKKIYSITARGREILSEWLKKEPQKTSVRSEFLLKIFFAGNIENKDVIVHLIKFQNDAKKELAQLEKIRLELGSIDNNSNVHAKFWLLSVDSGIKSTRAELAWCKDALATLGG